MSNEGRSLVERGRHLLRAAQAEAQCGGSSVRYSLYHTDARETHQKVCAGECRCDAAQRRTQSAGQFALCCRLCAIDCVRHRVSVP